MALLLVAPLTVGAPAVGGSLAGADNASSFQAFQNGVPIQGALASYRFVCADCWIRVTISGGGPGLVYETDGTVGVMVPGQYEIREFRGEWSYQTQGLGRFFVEFDGAGRVLRIS